ncbi:MAG: MFS transporter [Acidimicrobiia bacterium]|jgi:MFS family permease
MDTLPLIAPGDPDVRRIVAGRAIRGFADGFVSVLLAQYLTNLGFSPVEVGAIVTGTLLGSAVLTLGFGLRGHRVGLRSLLLVATVVMAATGTGFAAFTWFWPLLVVAVVGTLNPSAGDVSVFLPTEQAYLAERVDQPHRPRVFARYNLAAILAAALGALASALPAAVARWTGVSVVHAQRASFLGYAIAGLVILVIYRGLARGPDPVAQGPRRRALHTSRTTVLELTALFSVDAAAGGFVITSLLVLWLHLRFGLSPGTTAAVFFAAGLLGAASQLLAPRLSARIGLVRTMAFTHLPASALLVLAALAPTSGLAIACLLGRALLSQMDVPARQSLVMAVVMPDERAAAASVTNVPRSLAAATTPLLAGVLLTHSTFGWPLVIAGVGKMAYDLALLWLYHDLPEVAGARRVPGRRS